MIHDRVSLLYLDGYYPKISVPEKNEMMIQFEHFHHYQNHVRHFLSNIFAKSALMVLGAVSAGLLHLLTSQSFVLRFSFSRIAATIGPEDINATSSPKKRSLTMDGMA